MIDRIIELFRQHGSFNLVSHIQPDGDSIGSLLALGRALEMIGKRVRLFTAANVPQKYAFLEDSEKISASCSDWIPDAAAVVLDCSDLERTGSFKEYLGRAGVLINIDHHVTNCFFGTVNLVEPEAAATGEIIFRLLKAMQLNPTPGMAKALYVAISTDTGSFKFDNTTAATHRTAAALLESNLNPGALSQRIFDERPLSFYLLLKKVLATLEFFGGNRIAAITVSREMLEQCGALVEELDGMVNYTRNIEGVEIGIMFFIDSAAEIKVGFRSKSIDISKLARKLGGGGHARAAGCRLEGSYREVKEKVMAEVLSALESGSGRAPSLPD